jgi:hypothetical protein
MALGGSGHAAQCRFLAGGACAAAALVAAPARTGGTVRSHDGRHVVVAQELQAVLDGFGQLPPAACPLPCT